MRIEFTRGLMVMAAFGLIGSAGAGCETVGAKETVCDDKKDDDSDTKVDCDDEDCKGNAACPGTTAGDPCTGTTVNDESCGCESDSLCNEHTSCAGADPDCTAGPAAGGPCDTDGTCGESCKGGAAGIDPDCVPANMICSKGAKDAGCNCSCNSACEAYDKGKDQACGCDSACTATVAACGNDGHCDKYCTDDPDCVGCESKCDYNPGVCEACSKTPCTTTPCEKQFGAGQDDADCGGGVVACGIDCHCDTWCPSGVDPDCADAACNPDSKTSKCAP